MRILFTWELGSKLGHLASLIPLMDIQKRNGHDILVAVNNVQLAKSLLDPMGIQYVEAPMVGYSTRRGLCASYAEMLLAIGYEDESKLTNAVAAWLKLFDQYQPDLLVTNYSPTALLANRISKIKAIQIGTGFEIPPKDNWPAMIPLNLQQRQTLAVIESKLLTSINSLLESYHVPTLNLLPDLFNEAEQLLATFPELDHYKEREDANYIGPIYSFIESEREAVNRSEIHWLSVSSRKKVFLYAWPGLAGIGQLMLALANLNVEVIAVIPDLTDEAFKLFSKPNISIHRAPIDYGALIQNADLLISHSGFGTVNAFLKVGVPVLIVPDALEQLLFSYRVQASGMGLTMSNQRNPIKFTECISELLQNLQYKQAAQAFSAKYVHWGDDEAIRLATLKIDELLSLQSAKFVGQPISTVQ
jgi:UDP:flavonoid glycosyltransferase YjiC (YdhE family)